MLWIFISVINFPSSPIVLIGDSPPTLWLGSTQVTNVFPWKQTCHGIVTAGLSNEIQLCQRGTSWWPDWSHISTTVWLLTTKLLLNCVPILAVIVRHMHVRVSFGLFVSQSPFSHFVSVYLLSYTLSLSCGLSSTKAQHSSVWWHQWVEIVLSLGVKKSYLGRMIRKWIFSHGWKTKKIPNDQKELEQGCDTKRSLGLLEWADLAEIKGISLSSKSL